MKQRDIAKLLAAAKKFIHHSDYVVIGSVSIVCLEGDIDIPERMLMSIDLDSYPKSDPNRASELTPLLGESSDFARQNGYYFDAVSPNVATLPYDWKNRLVMVALDTDLRIHCLDPHDAAISKYARLEPRDVEWIRSGLNAGILTIPLLRQRMRHTTFLDDDETRRARRQLDIDEQWLATTVRK